MKNGNFYEESIEKWRLNEGKGTMLLAKKTDPKPIVLGILQKIYNRSPTTTTILVVENFDARTKMIEYLTTTDNEDNNKEFKDLINSKTLRVYTVDFMNKLTYNSYSLIIGYGTNTITGSVLEFMRRSTFRLCIINSLINDTDIRRFMYQVSPMLDGFDQNEINALRSSTPVEEYRFGVDLEDEEAELELQKCDKYINQSINIFGSFDIMNQCRRGNTQLNISADSMCKRIAEDNGWNESLDMSVPINVQVDSMYNPASLKERASLTYEVIRKRQNILSDANTKIYEIVNIIRNNPNETFLIISKRGEFAARITEYINKFTGSKCGDYHDKVDMIDAETPDGIPIYVKTGPNKGKRKKIGAQAQKTLNEEKFNRGIIKVLSTSASPYRELRIKVSNFIITSPMCDTIEEYIYRLGNITFDDKITLYSLYVNNTMEQKLLKNKDVSNVHTIVKDCENTANFDENSGVVFVD